MIHAGNAPTLSQALWPTKDSDAARWMRAALLVAVGVAAMSIAAKIKVPMWPVPITMQSFVVLTVGAAYGAGLGVITMLAYLAVGYLGFDIFTSSSPMKNGWEYMIGGSGGYLVGFVIAALVLGKLAQAGWDRSVPKLACAMLIGNALIYIPGLLWLNTMEYANGWAWTFENGLMPYLAGDALKLGIAALLLPAIWAARQR